MADKKTIIAIKVHFELNTKDGLKRVLFGLEKDNQGKMVVWKISFQLFERAKRTDAYDDNHPLVGLNIEVDQDHTEDAEQVAAANRFTSSQKSYALGTAAEAAKQAQSGQIKPEIAKEIIQDTLSS